MQMLFSYVTYFLSRLQGTGSSTTHKPDSSKNSSWNDGTTKPSLAGQPRLSLGLNETPPEAEAHPVSNKGFAPQKALVVIVVYQAVEWRVWVAGDTC